MLKELQDALDLPRLPARIECYDISNFHGTAIVGAMAVFVHGVPKKSDYRRFNITDLKGPNDFESMRQTLTRRLQRWKDETTTDASQRSHRPATTCSSRTPSGIRRGRRRS